MVHTYIILYLELGQVCLYYIGESFSPPHPTPAQIMQSLSLNYQVFSATYIINTYVRTDISLCKYIVATYVLMYVHYVHESITMLQYVVSTYVRKYVATPICAYVHTCIIPCTICTYFKKNKLTFW